MLNEQTIAPLNAMKIFGMARGFEVRLNSPQCADLSHADFVGLVMLELSSTRWIDAHRSVLITGPAGIGKSYMACALGNFAARSGYTVLYLRWSRLSETLQQSRGDGSHLKTLARLAKAQVLIIDDFLLTPPIDWERRDLLEIVKDRYQAGATVITSQCPVGDWHPNIGDPTLADAICDRLIHNAYKIELRGDSMRKNLKEGLAANQKNGKGGSLADDTASS